METSKKTELKNVASLLKSKGLQKEGGFIDGIASGSRKFYALVGLRRWQKLPR